MVAIKVDYDLFRTELGTTWWEEDEAILREGLLLFNINIAKFEAININSGPKNLGLRIKVEVNGLN